MISPSDEKSLDTVFSWTNVIFTTYDKSEHYGKLSDKKKPMK